MPNAAVLAARLAGRPLLMRDVEAGMYARQLLTLAPSRRELEARSGFAGFLSRARRALSLGGAVVAEDGRPAPEAYYPLWLEQAEGEREAAGFGWSLKGGVALIEIDGPLLDKGWACGWDDEGVWFHGYDTLAATFAEVASDPRVQAIFVRHDSPGGIASSGLPALAAQMRGLRAAAGGKPIWGWAEMSASADYWLGCSGDRLSAARVGVVGSIGAVVTHCDMSGALEKDGFVVEHIQFGAKKTDGSPYKPLSASARTDWQAEIDELGALFVADVVAGRAALTPEAVLATEAGCFFGDHTDKARSGLALGLIDAVQSEAEAFAELRALIGTTPHRSPAATAAPAAVKETDMNRSQVLASAKAAGFSTADVKKLEAKLPSAEAPAEDDPPAEDEDEEQDPPAETAAEDAPPADGEDEEEEGDKPDAKTALAIVDSPHAKGREAMARKLAGTPGMTLKRAEGLLQAAPKGGALAARLAGSPRVGADAPPKAKAFKSAADTFAANREAGLKRAAGR